LFNKNIYELNKKMLAMKNLLLLFFLFASLNLFGQAFLQVIHNSPDAAASTVDIYVNDAIYEDDFEFRESTAFREVPAGVELNIDIAPGNSASSAESIFNRKVTLEDGKRYVVVASGIVSQAGYDPATPFDLYIFDMATPVSASGTTNVNVFHGSTDAPVVDVVETAVPAGTIIDNLGYGAFSGNLELPTLDFIIDVRDETGMNTVISYAAPLQTLGLEGVGLTVVASGFLNPANNSDGAGFGLFVALPQGGELIPLPVYEYEFAKVQIIHNSADAIAAEVDVYVNGMKAIDNFAFRTATPFIELRAGVPTVIDIAPGNSMDVSESVYNVAPTLEGGKMYTIVANGIVVADGYDPVQPFGLYVFDMAMNTSASGTTNVNVFHGSTDAPVVDVVETAVPAGTIIDNLGYGEFSGNLELGTLDYRLDIRDETGEITVVSYSAPLETLGLGGIGLTVVASGFLNPANNSDGPAFGLYVALPAGGELIALPLTTAVQEIGLMEVNIYPNPVADRLMIQSENDLRTVRIMDMTGRVVMMENVSGGQEYRIDLVNLNNGQYILEVRDAENKIGIEKIVKF
jgi:hypothetical protein